MSDRSPVNELREWLKTQLGDGYYADEAPDEAVYPYRVGQLTSSFDEVGSTCEVWTFELDYWTAGKSYGVLYDLERSDRGDGDIIDPTGLDRSRAELAHGYAHLTHESLMPVEDPDRNMRRLRASYTIRLYYVKE